MNPLGLTDFIISEVFAFRGRKFTDQSIATVKIIDMGSVKILINL
ncbi:MAG TPA: hypothetical protein PK924_05895 [Bacilli bacterium]|jgi:hypothetical protein|nr:hypothetical protein [Bacilli bacterium]